MGDLWFSKRLETQLLKQLNTTNRKRKETPHLQHAYLAKCQWKHRLYVPAGSAAAPLIPITVIRYKLRPVFMHVNEFGFPTLS